MTLEVAFATFLDRLQLGRHQVDRINSTATTLSDRLRKHFGLHEDDVFLQGSYANRTAVKPPPNAEDGEYDVDLVVVSGSAGGLPRDAIRDMREPIEAIGYGDRIEDDGDRERPCIRLRYAPVDAGNFHVDVVPARRTSSGTAPLEVPRPSDGEWRPSAPQEYTQWCAQQGPEFAATVQELKRWRDETQTARQAIKSIVLQVLIANHMPHDLPDPERVAGALRGIADFLAQHTAGPPAVPNPVLPTIPANSPLDKDLDLYFAVSETTVPWPYSVYWKVKNYGAEAAAVNGLRGQITLASGGPNPTKHETTKYTGTHYVEVYIVKDGICRARAMQIVDIR